MGRGERLQGKCAEDLARKDADIDWKRLAITILNASLENHSDFRWGQERQKRQKVKTKTVDCFLQVIMLRLTYIKIKGVGISYVSAEGGFKAGLWGVRAR